jgi:hypothetical protein
LVGLLGGVQRASATELPVTTSVAGNSYSVTFSGEDAGLSFEVDTNSLDLLTTGGGWIPLVTGGHGSFGFVGGISQDLTPFGHVVYSDHDIGFRVISTSISTFTPGCLSTIMGSGNSTSGPVEFIVSVLDSGEPGTGDIFTIQVTGAVTDFESGILAGGDIQVHGLGCP